MGRLYDVIDDTTRQWLAKQPVFFVATAPNDPDGHVNLSPKGAAGAFRVLGPTRVAYVDLVGSGVETAAHLRENGRIVLMFCAFAGPPKIVRLHGRARVLPLTSKLRTEFADHIGARAIIDVAVTRVSDSCGYGVPKFGAPEPREALDMWTQKKGAEGLAAYRRQKNARSIDDLPALAPEDEA